MSWGAEAFRAFKKIILLEERMSQLADRVDGLVRLIIDMDWRLLRLETKWKSTNPRPDGAEGPNLFLNSLPCPRA